MTERPDEAEQRQRAERACQGHLFAEWSELSASSRTALLETVSRIDFAGVAERAALLQVPATEGLVGDVRPPELFPLERGAEHEREARAAVQRGEELFAEGKVGFLLVAGGQASRLGYDGPKGAFRIGPVSGAPLFAFHARRLLAARQRYGCAVPWYVMTSAANHRATVACFEEHEHFGLEPDAVRFFSQAMIPAVDFEGRILMSAPERPFLAPNGHGGSLQGFFESGALAHARERGVEVLSYFQVDNPLARPVDPLFLGLHAAARAGMSSKVVAKRDADEKVGVLGLVDGRMGCIEYSDLPAELREARDAEGRLRFRAGNIAIHLLGLDFVDALCRDGLELPWHVARKTMDVHTPEGPARVMGAKFETFVFDALGRSPTSVTLEVDRALEFSPVKNRDGTDSPATARRDLCRLHAGWVRAAGLPLPDSAIEGQPAVEVDPRVAEDEASFRRIEAPAPERRAGGHLYR